MGRGPRVGGLAAIAAGVVLLAGCGEVVTVQPGEVGRELSASGFRRETIGPGVVRLASCSMPGSTCPRIVRLETGRVGVDVAIDSIFLPSSNVDVSNVRVGLQYRVRPGEASVDRVFREVRPETDRSGQLHITARAAWDTFGARVVPAVVVDVLKDLRVEQVMNTGSELSGIVHAAVSRAMAGTPVEVTELAVVDTDVPPAVMESKRRLFAIDDNRERQLKELEVGIAVEERRRAFQAARAASDARVATQLGLPVAEYVCLKTNERLADAADDRGSTVVLVPCWGRGDARFVLPMRPAAPAPSSSAQTQSPQ